MYYGAVEASAKGSLKNRILGVLFVEIPDYLLKCSGQFFSGSGKNTCCRFRTANASLYYAKLVQVYRK